LLQHLPEGEEGRERLHTRLDHPEWEHVAALANTMGGDELADPAASLETLVWRLFNEEEDVRVLASGSLAHACRCSAEHFASVIAQFPPEDREAMADETGTIWVDCQFCASHIPVRLAEAA
jgi:molecular chaperone Hsp33